MTRGFMNDVRAISAYAPYVDAMFVDRECADGDERGRQDRARSSQWGCSHAVSSLCAMSCIVVAPQEMQAALAIQCPAGGAGRLRIGARLHPQK